MTYLIDGTSSKFVTGGFDDFTAREVTNEFSRKNCTNADLWNDIAHSVVALERRLSLHGSEGTFNFPTGIAVDGDNELLYVADGKEHCLGIYSLTGSFVASIGGYGTEPGRFRFPSDVAVDLSGNVHVVDLQNKRVQVFDYLGKYQFSYDGSTSTSGRFNMIWPVIAGQRYSGSWKECMWVLDWDMGRLIAFRQDNGAFMHERVCSLATPLGYPRDMAWSVSDKKVIIPDPDNERVVVYDPQANTWTATAVSSGPMSVCVDGDGAIWLGFYRNAYLRKYTLTGSSLSYAGVQVLSGGVSPRLKYGIACCSVAGWGNTLYLSDTGGAQVQAFSFTGIPRAQWDTLDTKSYRLSFPADVAVDSSGLLYIVDSDNCFVVKMADSGIAQLRFGEKGTTSGKMAQPVGIDVALDGTIFVSDMTRNRVLTYSPSGTYIGSITTSISTPSAIAVSGNGELMYLANQSGTQLLKFVKTGGTWGTPSTVGSKGTGEGKYNWITSVALDPSGNVYVLDATSKSVIKYNSAGAYQQTFTNPAFPALTTPRGLTVDASGNLYISCTRGKVYTYKDSNWTSFGSFGSGNGQFGRAMNLARFSSGNLAIADPDNRRVQVVSSTGAFIREHTVTNSGIFSPEAYGGSKLVRSLSGKMDTRVSALYSGACWEKVTLSSTKIVTSDSTSEYIYFNLAFDCEADEAIWPIDWRASVRVSNASLTAQPIVEFIRPANGSGSEPSWAVPISGNRYTLNYRCRIRMEDDSLLPVAGSQEPYIINAMLQIMRR